MSISYIQLENEVSRLIGTLSPDALAELASSLGLYNRQLIAVRAELVRRAQHEIELALPAEYSPESLPQLVETVCKRCIV